MKIAPALCDVVLLGHSAYPEDEQMTRAARQLRALLAVARASGPAVEAMRRMVPEWMRRSTAIGRLERSERRLARVSGGGGTKGRRR